MEEKTIRTYECEICIEVRRDELRRPTIPESSRSYQQQSYPSYNPFVQLVPVAKADMRFVQSKMEFERIRLRGGESFDGPMDMGEFGRMLQTSYWVILRDGARFQVHSSEGSDRWYFKRMNTR